MLTPIERNLTKRVGIIVDFSESNVEEIHDKSEEIIELVETDLNVCWGKSTWRSRDVRLISFPISGLAYQWVELVECSELLELVETFVGKIAASEDTDTQKVDNTWALGIAAVQTGCFVVALVGLVHYYYLPGFGNEEPRVVGYVDETKNFP